MKPRSKSILAVLFAALLGAVFAPSAVKAAVTCGAAASEEGGTHKRCTGSDGVFHMWTPSSGGGDGLVVYVHGYSLPCGKPSPEDATDGVTTAYTIYVDGVWPDHKLARQFKQSGLNRTFLAVQAPVCGSSKPGATDTALRWRNFGTLMADAEAAGATSVKNVIVIGHSGAYRQMRDWMNDESEITHLIHLDTIYANVTDFKNWHKSSGHSGTIISTSETKKNSTDVAAAVPGAVTMNAPPASFAAMTEGQKKAKLLHAASNVTHMQIVTGGQLIPMTLARAATASDAGAPAPAAPSADSPAPAGGGTAAPAGTATGALTGVPVGGSIDSVSPRLEVAIPGVEFSKLVAGSGNLNIPWLGQYVAGVYNFLIAAVGVIAAVMMIVGGFQYLMSRGDAGQVKAARQRIENALVGLVLSLGSYALLYAINPDLVRFKSLQLMQIQTVLIEDYTDGAGAGAPLGPGIAEPPLPPPPAPPPNAAPGSNVRTCKDTASCLPYCRAAGCTTVLCYKGNANCPPASLPGFEGVTLKAVGSTHASDCDIKKFPEIPPGAPVSPITWPGIHNIIPNGQTASQLVIDGLRRAEQYIDQHYAGQNLKISLSNCYRDTRRDFAWQCTIIMRPPEINNDPSSTTMGSTWPGSNPHSSGYACDLALVKDGKKITPGNLSSQRCAKYTEAEKLLVEILTNPYVGARRLNYEYWHFNWAGWNSCYCAGAECDNHIMPIGCNKNAPLDEKTCERL